MRDDRYDYDLLDTCRAVHMSLTGASDPLKDFEESVEWLRSRLEDWKPGPGRAEAFDEAVKAVLVAALAEVERAGHEPILRQRDTLPAPVSNETRERLAALETKLSTARAVVDSCRKFCGPSCPVCREQIAAVLGEP